MIGDRHLIEDADHLLMARANGNVDPHRILAVADGVVRAQGRKIIFTTNPPNVGDIDEALVRVIGQSFRQQQNHQSVHEIRAVRTSASCRIAI
jgi:hypothetical protein